jgi:hypothetical protein
LVPTPTRAILAAIRRILSAHNVVEEEPGGGDEAEALLARLRAAPEVPVHAHVDGERIMEATRRALARAGYRLDEAE